MAPSRDASGSILVQGFPRFIRLVFSQGARSVPVELTAGEGHLALLSLKRVLDESRQEEGPVLIGEGRAFVRFRLVAGGLGVVASLRRGDNAEIVLDVSEGSRLAEVLQDALASVDSDDPDDPESTSGRMRVAFDLFEAGEEIMRQNLRRDRPDASEDEIEARLVAWLQARPGAEFGDGPGEPVPWPRL